jgi:hypothetical protein
MPDKAPIYSVGGLFTPGHTLHALPRGKGQPPKPLSDFGLRGGLQLRSAGYFAATLALVWVLRHIPFLSLVTGLPPGWLVYLTLPPLVAYKLTVFEPAGRPVRHWLGTMAMHHAMPNQRSAGRVLSREGVPHICDGLTAIAVQPDSTTLRKCDIHGPGVVTFHEEVEYMPKRRGHPARVRPLRRRPKDMRRVTTSVTLQDGERLLVRP